VRGTTEQSGEAALIRAAQAGDKEAFEQLVRSYDQQVLRMALNLLRSPEDARDIYQEAFLRVYRSLPKFRFDCSFSTWLYRIVANLCLDQIRKRKVRKEEAAAVSVDGAEWTASSFSRNRGRMSIHSGN
jgi:RNA polymerase sigma-70 factor (ECF subfamily)